MTAELNLCQQNSLGGRLRRCIAFVVLQLADRHPSEVRPLLMPI